MTTDTNFRRWLDDCAAFESIIGDDHSFDAIVQKLGLLAALAGNEGSYWLASLLHHWCWWRDAEEWEAAEASGDHDYTEKYRDLFNDLAYALALPEHLDEDEYDEFELFEERRPVAHAA